MKTLRLLLFTNYYFALAVSAESEAPSVSFPQRSEATNQRLVLVIPSAIASLFSQQNNGSTRDGTRQSADAKMSLTPPPRLAACFAKLRIAARLAPAWAREFDDLVEASRLDVIHARLTRRIEQLCEPEERNATHVYFQEHAEAFQIGGNLTRNLTTDELDLLNVWRNLKDDRSEREFFSSKFNKLHIESQNITRKAQNEILNLFSRAQLEPYQSIFFAQFLDANESLKKLQKVIDGGDAAQIRALVAQYFHLATFNTQQRAQITRFLERVAEAFSLKNNALN